MSNREEHMKRILVVFAGLMAVAAALPLRQAALSDEPVLSGFSAESSRAERQWEEKFKAIPKPDLMREYMRKLSARPHHVGSEYDKNNAEWLAAKFKEFALDTPIQEFNIFF